MLIIVIIFRCLFFLLNPITTGEGGGEGWPDPPSAFLAAISWRMHQPISNFLTFFISTKRLPLKIIFCPKKYSRKGLNSPGLIVLNEIYYIDLVTGWKYFQMFWIWKKMDVKTSSLCWTLQQEFKSNSLNVSSYKRLTPTKIVKRAFIVIIQVH